MCHLKLQSSGQENIKFIYYKLSNYDFRYLRMLKFFKKQNSSSFSHNETITILVYQNHLLSTSRY